MLALAIFRIRDFWGFGYPKEAQEGLPVRIMFPAGQPYNFGAG